MEQDPSYRTKKVPFNDPRQRWVFYGFFLFSAIILVVGVVRLVNGLNIDPSPLFKSADSAENRPVLDSDELIKKDTDGDGIFDDIETGVYQTSAYLADTDGDGLTDSQEIKAGSDPLCATGQECNRQTSSTASEKPDIQRPQSAEELLKDNPLLTGQISPEDLRSVLIQGGVDQALLEQVTDDQLYGLYQEILDGGLDNLATDNTITPDQAENLSVEEIRQLLRQSGADPAIVDALSEEQIQELYTSTLSNLNTGN
jgi:hypothetical protein